MRNVERDRVDEIGREVRRAVGRLRRLERVAIEAFYFEGLSVARIARSEGASINRVLVAQRQAFRELRVMLAPFVARMFGIEATCVPTCPICIAPWREDAEALIESKTADQTWGEIIVRIERATGWKTRSPQVLIAHQRKHRTFQTERTDDDQAGAPRGARSEDQHLDGLEDELGEFGEDDGPPAGGCLPDPPLDGTAGIGGD